MADYNQWMNNRIYKTASMLSLEELSKDRGAFFGSIIGTLNHILVGDTLWLKRFANHPSEPKSLECVRGLENPRSLNDILYPELEGLRQARTKLDEAILNFSHELTDQDLSSSLSYSNTKGEPFTKNYGYLIQHFFNHQTHHRGQVSTLLSQAGMEVGVTDLLARIPNVAEI